MSASHPRAHSAGMDSPESAQNNAAVRTVASPRPATPLVRERRLQRVVEMIESGPSRTVRELAFEVHLSPAHLQRLFKHETGGDVSELLAERRLQRAAHLLSGSDMPIKEIAYAVGYEHHSSFVRAFQRRFAQAPRRYRQQTTA